MAHHLSNQHNSIAGSHLEAGGSIHIGDTISHIYVQNGQTIQVPELLTHYIPLSTDHIVGRTAELTQAHTHLSQHRATVLFYGIGGMGKTSVAAKYMVTFAHDYKHRAWITVQSSLVEAFVYNTTLLDNLHITEKVQGLLTAQQFLPAFECVLNRLSQLGNTLVVVDNANDLADLVEYKSLFDSVRFHCLITSRSQPQEWTTVPIDHLPPDEAVALFQKWAKMTVTLPTEVVTWSHHLSETVSESVTSSHRLTDANQPIKNLLAKLYFHTLLIELVAKAMVSAGWIFEEMAEMIESRFIHHEDLREEPLATGKHGESLPENLKRATIEDYIWHIFKNVTHLDDKPKDILRGFALLPLGKAMTRDEAKDFLAILGITGITHPLSILTERGWLDKVQATGQKPRYTMHPLIADVVVKHLDASVSFAKAYIHHVANRIDYDNTNPQHHLLTIHQEKPTAERLMNLFLEENTEEVSELLNNLGYLEENFGFYQKAALLKERALAIAQTIFDKNHAIIAARQSNLANVYGDLGRYAEAVDLLEAALDSGIRNFGKDHPSVAIRQSNLANVYRDLGRYAEAADLLEAALDSDVRNFGKDHPSVAIRQSSLAIVYRNLGRYAEAAELSEAALDSDVRNFGKDHPSVAIRQSNLANVYRDLGRYAEAATLLEAALDSSIHNFGKDHPLVATYKNNLAWVFYQTGQKAEAKALWQAAYQNCLKNFGAAHPHTVLLKEYSEMD
ncbi:MAG: ATP-binding protein [Saprospiraceae bacterium]|nr:ATP-binding protein [Saprospiraceae bacterium]